MVGKQHIRKCACWQIVVSKASLRLVDEAESWPEICEADLMCLVSTDLQLLRFALFDQVWV
eukprot:5863109-Prorocentrum_lima.AAC.1